MADKRKSLKSTYPLYVASKPRFDNFDLDVIDKYTEEVATRVGKADSNDMEDAIAAAHKTWEEGKRLGQDNYFPTYQRKAVLNYVAKQLEKRKEEFAIALVIEAGKPLKDSRGEVQRAIDTFKISAEETGRAEGRGADYARGDGSERGKGTRLVVQPQPIGPLALISPFNFPLNLVAHKVGPALATGCPFVLKPASRTPLSALLLAEILAECTASKESEQQHEEENDEKDQKMEKKKKKKKVPRYIPEGFFSVVPCDREVGQQLVEDERLKKLSFTGSDKIGWKMYEQASASKKRVTLELGGNAACIVDRNPGNIPSSGGRQQKKTENEDEKGKKKKEEVKGKDLEEEKMEMVNNEQLQDEKKKKKKKKKKNSDEKDNNNNKQEKEKKKKKKKKKKKESPSKEKNPKKHKTQQEQQQQDVKKEEQRSTQSHNQNEKEGEGEGEGEAKAKAVGKEQVGSKEEEEEKKEERKDEKAGGEKEGENEAEEAEEEGLVERLVFGMFYQSGQSCISVQRLFVHEAQWDRILPRLVRAVQRLPMGDPMDEGTFLGPLISQEDAQRMEEWIDEALHYSDHKKQGQKQQHEEEEEEEEEEEDSHQKKKKQKKKNKAGDHKGKENYDDDDDDDDDDREKEKQETDTKKDESVEKEQQKQRQSQKNQKQCRVLVGGKRKGAFFEGTLLENVPHGCRLWREEVFGPLCCVEKFSDFARVIEEVNDSRFGLQAGIFTADLQHAFYAFEHLDVGGVVIGDVPSVRIDSQPYGGSKDSGLGREGVKYAMEEMSQLRVMILKNPTVI